MAIQGRFVALADLRKFPRLLKNSSHRPFVNRTPSPKNSRRKSRNKFRQPRLSYVPAASNKRQVQKGQAIDPSAIKGLVELHKSEFYEATITFEAILNLPVLRVWLGNFDRSGFGC
jgi:hypothetical protein